MGTKTISITNEAYDWLKSKKGEKDSFSDVIVKHFARRSLLELAGTLTDEEAEELRKHIREGRKRSRARVDRIAKLLGK